MGREEAYARRRQLDGQGQAVQPNADFGHVPGVFDGEHKIGLYGAGAFHKEGHGGQFGQHRGRGHLLAIGQRERLHGKLAFAVDAQQRPAGNQDVQPWRIGQQLRHQRPGMDHLLKVVEHKEHLPWAQVGFQRIQVALIRTRTNAQCLGDHRCHQFGVVDGCKLHQKDAMLILVHQIGSHGQREACLADAAGAGEGDQPHCEATEQRLHRCDLAVATNQ